MEAEIRSIRPALTPEEWRERIGPWEDWEEPPLTSLPAGSDGALELIATSPEGAHYAAAVFLHGQSFGFTWEDVRALSYGNGMGAAERAFALADLADRIAALLPPRE